MTIKEKAEQMLFERGVFKWQAEEVVKRVMDDPANRAVHWNDAAEGYPKELLAVLWYAVKREALAYIEENCPKVWYRSQFESEEVSR